MTTEDDVAAVLADLVPLGDQPTEREIELGEAVNQIDHPQPPPRPSLDEHEHVFRCLRCGATPDEAKEARHHD